MNFKHKINKIYSFVLLGMIFLLGFIEVDLSFLGGLGDFSYSLKLGLAIVMLYVIIRLKISRYIYYLLLTIFLLINHYDNKREILYVIILIIFIELLKRDSSLKFKLKQLLIYFFIGVSLLFVFLTSSIARGYGNYEVDDPIEASYYVLDYIREDYIVDALLSNFELLTVYGNTSNAVDYLYKGEVDPLYGTTFIKFIFLPISRDVMPRKPSSVMSYL